MTKITKKVKKISQIAQSIPVFCGKTGCSIGKSASVVSKVENANFGKKKPAAKAAGL